MSQNNVLAVEITNLTRLHIADSANPTGNRRVDDREVKYTNTTSTRVPLILNTQNGERQRMESVPVINANLLRGRLRRNIATRIFDSMRERGLGISVDLIHLLTTLASSGSPNSAKTLHNAMLAKDPVKEFTGKGLKPEKDDFSSNDTRTEYLKAMTSDPFVALFGGGPNLWRSRLVTPDFMPNITALQKPYLINSTFAEKFERPPMDIENPFVLYEYLGTVRGDDVYANAGRLSNNSNELETWIKIESVGGKKADANEEDSVGKSNLRNMMTLETVRPGLSFIGQIIVKNEDVSEDTFNVMSGLIQLAVNDLHEEQIGGVVRNGWGKVAVSIADGEDQEQIKLAETYLNTVTVESLMEAFGVAVR